jgi:DNA ligase-1
MKKFAQLFEAIDASTSTKAKTAALADYFIHADARDAAWAAWFLTGHRPRQAVPSRRLATWASEAAALPLWLFEESYDAVGDLAETIALILPPPTARSDLPLHVWVEERLIPLRELAEAEQRARLESYWVELEGTQRFVFNKLITGNFRVGVSALLVVRAIAQAFGLDPKVVAHRLTGDWWPSEALWRSLIDAASIETDRSNPYPFFLAHALDGGAEALGERDAWLAEWKWDGIRAQMIRRGDVTALWSRGDEPIAGQFPELMADAQKLPDCVLDGEILAWKDGAVMPFAALQKRLGRKNPGKKVMGESPVIFLAFDLLELAGEDWRERPLAERRAKLRDVLLSVPGGSRFEVSSELRAPTWDTLAIARAQSREQGTEGLMLKRLDSPYGVGRPRGAWWKWKIEPYTLDAVLIYAQKGHGKREPLHRLHLRHLARRRARAFRQGVLGPQRRGDPRGRRLHPQEHPRALRSGAHREARARLRAGLRRHPALGAAQVRQRRALPADAAHAQGQAHRRGQHPRGRHAPGGAGIIPQWPPSLPPALRTASSS